ncbi:MAG: TetR/AcrR family transcriptional regulator [Roseburia sp.]
MPPKARIRKQDIVAAGLAIVKEQGADALNARELARQLGCSTQPVFSNYATMEELKTDVIEAANQLYQKYLEEGMKDPAYPPYKASGMAYIRFAKEEKELFKLLFMRDRSGEHIVEKKDDMAGIIRLVEESTGLAEQEAHLFHLEMWIYVHGIATMMATSYLDWDWEMVSRVLTDAYQGMRIRYRVGENDTGERR